MESSITQLKNIYYNTFSSCISNFKECSKDSTNNVYLVSSLKECINYDLIKDNISFQRNHLCSVDSVAFDEVNNTILFIEFKDSIYNSTVKENYIKSSQDSFLINCVIISLHGDNDMNNIKRKSVLVLNKYKNSSTISNYYACKRSNKLDKNTLYRSFKSKLIDYSFNGFKLFDEIEIVCEDKFDDVVKNI